VVKEGPVQVQIPNSFNSLEAVSWLHSVDGDLYRTPLGGRDTQHAWIAVVQTPRFGVERRHLILALGDSALEAATAAASQWHAIWDRAPRDA
jgi:hypothetical protein